MADAKGEFFRDTSGYLSQWFKIKTFNPLYPHLSHQINPLQHFRRNYKFNRRILTDMNISGVPDRIMDKVKKLQ